MNINLIKTLAAAVMLLLAGCDRIDPRTEYACQMSGETFRYKDGVRLGGVGGWPTMGQMGPGLPQ